MHCRSTALNPSMQRIISAKRMDIIAGVIEHESMVRGQQGVDSHAFLSLESKVVFRKVKASSIIAFMPTILMIFYFFISVFLMVCSTFCFYSDML